MLKIKLGLLVIILQLSTLALSDDDSSCVDNYLDFEEQTFNNSENRVKLYQVFYPPSNHLPYSVVVTYQAALPSGTRVDISTDHSCPDRQVWLRVSSLILFLLDPRNLNFLVGHVVFVVYAFLVAPFAVTVNAMLLVLSVMCLANIMTLVFTVSASVGFEKCLRSRADCVATVRAAMLIPLLLVVICFSLLLVFSSNFVNTATQQNSFPMLLKSLITPVLLVAVSLSLKRFILVLVHESLGGVRDVNDPPGHGNNGYQVLDNDNVLQ